MTPQFTHDCTECQLIAVAKRADIYVCKTSLIARTGNQGSHYTSFPLSMVDTYRNEMQGALSPIYQLMLGAYINHLYVG